MIFGFVVRRLRWLARVPGAPQLFDTLLLVNAALFHRGRVTAIEAVETAALCIRGISLRVHRLGGVGFAISGEEVAHLHGNGLFDAHVGRRSGTALVASGRAQWHHVFGRSTWVSFQIRDRSDSAVALEVLKEAIERQSRASQSVPHARPDPEPQATPANSQRS